MYKRYTVQGEKSGIVQLFVREGLVIRLVESWARSATPCSRVPSTPVGSHWCFCVGVDKLNIYKNGSSILGRWMCSITRFSMLHYFCFDYFSHLPFLIYSFLLIKIHKITFIVQNYYRPLVLIFNFVITLVVVYLYLFQQTVFVVSINGRDI